jgi:hypothetical protein
MTSNKLRISIVFHLHSPYPIPSCARSVEQNLFDGRVTSCESSWTLLHGRMGPIPSRSAPDTQHMYSIADFFNKAVYSVVHHSLIWRYWLKRSLTLYDVSFSCLCMTSAFAQNHVIFEHKSLYLFNMLKPSVTTLRPTAMAAFTVRPPLALRESTMPKLCVQYHCGSSVFVRFVWNMGWLIIFVSVNSPPFAVWTVSLFLTDAQEQTTPHASLRFPALRTSCQQAFTDGKSSCFRASERIIISHLNITSMTWRCGYWSCLLSGICTFWIFYSHLLADSFYAFTHFIRFYSFTRDRISLR